MTRGERWAVVGSTVAVGASGLLYAWVRYVPRAPNPADPFAVGHPWEPVLLKLHVLTGPIFVFALGLVFLRHIWAHWARGLRLGRRSGVAGVVTAALLVGSGYAVQVLAQPTWLRVTGWGHTALGVLYLGLFAVHWGVTRRARRERAAPSPLPRSPRRRQRAGDRRTGGGDA